MEISFTVVGFEKRADGAIPVIRAERSATAIELGEDAAGLARFENRAADEQRARAESWTCRDQQQRGEE
jgi:hypothetical protein